MGTWGSRDGGSGDISPGILGHIGLAEADSGGCTGEEDAEPTRGRSSFPCATVMGFCSCTQQGWGAGKHRNPWENPAARRAAGTGNTGRVHGGLPR